MRRLSTVITMKNEFLVVLKEISPFLGTRPTIVLTRMRENEMTVTSLGEILLEDSDSLDVLQIYQQPVCLIYHYHKI